MNQRLIFALMVGCGTSTDAPTPRVMDPLPASSAETLPPRVSDDASVEAEGRGALLRFKGDVLTDCFESSVRQSLEVKTPVERMAGAAGFAAAETYMNRLTDKFSDTMMPLLEESEKRTTVPTLGPWPPKDFADQFRRGELAFADACPSDRVVLGSCLLVASSRKITVVTTHLHLDVASTRDSDAGMRACIVEGGQWKAVARRDADASMESMRQHAADLERLLK